jgi:hypothetical protein
MCCIMDNTNIPQFYHRARMVANFPSHILHRISFVNVLHVRFVFLAHLLRQAFLLLLGYTAGSHYLVTSFVLPHIVQSPAEDQDGLQTKTDGADNRAHYVAGCILRAEDLCTNHVAGTVGNESHSSNKGVFGLTGGLGGHWSGLERTPVVVKAGF